MRNFFIVLILIVLALVGFRIYQSYSSTAVSTTDERVASRANVILTSDNSVYSDGFTDSDNIAPTYVDLGSNKPPTYTAQDMISFSCDGRQHCAQMTSCAEATYFNNYCPDTKMDGNYDGVPCEQQWC
ncbi:excalibur calcium-binding domain-containing protein [Psychrobacter sp. M13]|uniref:excalibur calcium-binding domain-containing protein n=1 Tax=Psychrobacter sp. M13 TaxID=3067275 RepID=UPI00273BD6BB|nr:excalibur calcium-binding domain-containing protein [Psychrobacter sp. M13]WLP95599.1 excalibur calcium-binding domain-containing protein [Psychrobacter sp. M13]